MQKKVKNTNKYQKKNKKYKKIQKNSISLIHAL